MTKQAKVTKRKKKKKETFPWNKPFIPILAILLLILIFSIINNKISKNHFNTLTNSKAIPVIDVSKWEGEIDWKKVQKSGIEHAILKIGSGDYNGEGFHEDPLFHTNYESALQNNIKCGVYFFSYAVTKQEAEKEALFCLNLLEKYNIEPDDLYFPVAFDIEYDKALRTGKRNCTDMTIAFCETLKNAGYEPMVYSSASYLDDTLIYREIRDYKLWVANYEVTGPDFGKPYVMWQYSDTAHVDGIDDLCDMNYWYPDYVEVKKIEIHHDTITLSPGESVTIDARITPEYATNKRLTYTSSNEHVVKIMDTMSGEIQASQRGTSWITVRTPSGIKERIKITVE